MYLFRVAGTDMVSHHRGKVHRHVRHVQSGQVDLAGDELRSGFGELRGMFVFGVTVAHHHE